jgi:SLOG-like protein/TIR domain-containing protein
MVPIRYEWAPLRIFVIWHPGFAAGEPLFRSLYDWLGGPERALHRRGIGVPVQPWTSADPDLPPLLPPLDTQALTVVVAFLDGELVGRRAWRSWFELLESRRGTANVIVLPWAVHRSTAHVPGVGVLHLIGSGECSELELCRRVTEACVIRARGELRPLRIFVSYARRDGGAAAREVRQALHAYGHLSVFLDEHDLHPGRGWREALMSEIKDGAAMFAIVTDAYANRAWCREELRKFREPLLEDRTSSQWWLRPVFILDDLSGAATRSMFETGSAPVARWTPTRAAEIVDELVREVLLAELNRMRARQIAPEPGRHVVNWVPDTWTLLQVLRNAPPGECREIAYPGGSLPRIEVERLSSALGGIALRSFEELDGASTADPARRGTVMVSISDPPRKDLAARGLHPVHLDDAALRIARALLNDNFDVMYGGRPRAGFTSGFQDDTGAVVIEPRLINFVGWPHTTSLSPSQIADDFGVTRYVAIEAEPGLRADDAWDVAHAASATRQRSVAPGLCDLDEREVASPRYLIALGGQVEDFSGFLPGVAEEVAIAVEAGLHVFVLGGFGGAAEQVALLFQHGKAPLLTPEALARSPKYPRLRAAAEQRGQVAFLAEKAAWLHRVLGGRELANGLSPDENRELYVTQDLGRIITLVRRGLGERRART